MSNQFDMIIAGGGVMGCAIAYNLLKMNDRLRVLVVERDSTYVKSSTVLSDGNIRTQFNIRENIAISQYGLEVLARFAEEMATDEHVPDIAFRQQGNIFVVNEAGRKTAVSGLALQKSMGCTVEWLNGDQISQIHPLFAPADAVGGCYGPYDGTMSPLDVLLGYRRKAIALGAVVLQADVARLRQTAGRIHGITLADGTEYTAPVVVNATGAWANRLGETVGITLPIAPTKRQVYAIETDLHFDRILPLMLLHTGQYLLHEGNGRFATGGALPSDPITYDDFSWSQSRFEEQLWEGLITYFPALDRLKVTNGWAGLYAVNTFDGNAILGEWPELPGLFLANGFSGHGFQQCHAVGRYLAERILQQPHALDLSIFSPQRILDNKPVFENPERIV
ncbi:MAG: FAD-binding oxidoreductase [Anaerolineales bacterium]|nr:FAD-binding oxidoreductase [Anaerolineales bacterium]